MREKRTHIILMLMLSCCTNIGRRNPLESWRTGDRATSGAHLELAYYSSIMYIKALAAEKYVGPLRRIKRVPLL